MPGYDHKSIETRWQSYWAERGTFRTPNPGGPGFDPARPKYYVLDMFPYPSGVGLHVGHPLGYIATDIVARYKKMRGFNVLHPMGFDAFGLPAEQFAVEHGVHPRVTTERNIANMVRQLKRLGLGYDWDRTLSTTDVGYYKWTQWIFLQLYNSYFDAVEHKARPITPGDRSHDHERLAYIAQVPVNWCPALGTVLANEEVTNDGRSERGNHPVYKRPLKQWMLRITAYAERLATELDTVDWPEPIKLMQRNWIGRSEGARVDFGPPHFSGAGPITVFTTRPDTLFGATYMVLAPEHTLVDEITTPQQRDAVRDYQRLAAARSDMDRQADAKKKTGVFTGGYAINPVNQHRIPIWIADYVMMGYGTGAIMAVPAHDDRDFEFAKQFDLPIRAVVMPPDDRLREMFAEEAARQFASGNVAESYAVYDMESGVARKASRDEIEGVMGKFVDELAPTRSKEHILKSLTRLNEAEMQTVRDDYVKDVGSLSEPFTGEGASVNSVNDEVSLDGLPTTEAKKKITQWLEDKGLGKAQVQYKLRDWLFSRQRYWGEPFPILHAPDGRVIALDESELPVELPEMEDFSPQTSDDPNAPPRPPLARAPESWRIVERDGERYERELNTMPQWAGSCWYFLRFLDPQNKQRFVGQDAEKYWMAPRGIDLYVGGAEHAVLHLLYSRFWHKVLHDLGHVSTPEPFGRLFNQGYIQAYAYQDARGMYVEATKVEQKGDNPHFEGRPVTRSLGKMGKSLKNAVSPDDMAEEYGADTLRLYEMYMGPLEASKPWETRDIVGLHRFIQRIWRNFVGDDDRSLVTDEPATDDLLRLTHKTIRRVTDSMERLAFNTAIAALIEMNNELVGRGSLPRSVAEPFVLMLAPFAPHLAEELGNRLGHTESVSLQTWPVAENRYVLDATVEVVVQIMGKVRGRITVPADADAKAIESAALADEKIAPQLVGKTVKKVVVVPGKLVNIVAS